MDKILDKINDEWTCEYWGNMLKIKEKYGITEDNFYKLISSNPNITWDIISKNIDKPWDWYDIKNNPNITWDVIRDNPKELHKLWNFDSLYTKSSITSKGLIDLNNLISYDSNLPNFWKQISRKPDLTWDVIKECAYKPWDWFYISSNPTVTWDIINYNKYLPWSWISVSKNPNITWDIISSNPGKPWDWFGISSNPNITWDVVKNNLDKKWVWYHISQNSNITWDIISSNQDVGWDWDGISLNPTINLEIVLENPDEKWNVELLCKNPNISWEIMDNLDNFDNFSKSKSKSNWYYITYNILYNTMQIYKERFIKKKLILNNFKYLPVISDISDTHTIISEYI